MKLLYQTHSPFARKVLIFAYEIGLVDQIEIIHHETSPTNRNEDVFALNPLGKVPVLVSNERQVIFDSRVICSYLDQLHSKPKLIPVDSEESIAALRLEALSDGLSEAGILARWEDVRRPEHLRHKPFLKGQLTKILEGYNFIETQVELSNRITIGEIALASTLSWLEFRDVLSFRGTHPNITAWYDKFSERASMKLTSLVGETHD